MVNQPKQSLHNRINMKSGTNSDNNCKHCGQNNHNTMQCKHLGKSKCAICGKFGYIAKKCWDRDKDRDKGLGKRKKFDKRSHKHPRKEDTNEGEEENDEEEL